MEIMHGTVKIAINKEDYTKRTVMCLTCHTFNPVPHCESCPNHWDARRGISL